LRQIQGEKVLSWAKDPRKREIISDGRFGLENLFRIFSMDWLFSGSGADGGKDPFSDWKNFGDFYLLKASCGRDWKGGGKDGEIRFIGQRNDKGRERAKLFKRRSQ